MDDTGKKSQIPAIVPKSKRGFKRYETNPSVPPSGGLSTRTKRVEVPGGKAAVILDNSTGEIRGIGGMGFWWNEEVDKGRFVSATATPASPRARRASSPTLPSDGTAFSRT